MTLRSIKKILSVTLSVLFLLQQGGFVFATTDVSTWADLQAGIAGAADEYNVTTALTADDSPNGTLNITADGYSVTGANLTANGDNDPLVNIANAITFGLGNNISGSIVNNGTLNYSGSSLASGAVTGNGTFNFLGVTVTNANTIEQTAVSVDAATTLTNNAAITATTFTNNGVVDNNAAITGAITNEGTLTSTADNLVGAVENNNTLNLEGGAVQAAISGNGTTNVTADLSSDYAIEQTNFAISNNAYVTQNATLTAAVSNASGSTLEIDPDNLAGAVANEGTLKFNAGGALAQDITGNGLTRFDGNEEIVLDDANSIAQDTIKVGTSATLTANASNLSATTEVFNDGQLNLTGGTNANAINGDGAVEFSGASVINNGAIAQANGVVNNADSLTNAALITAEITNNLNKSLTSDASNLNGAVHNGGVLNLTGGTTQDDIDGDGNLFILTGDVTNEHAITQHYLTATSNFINNDTVTLDDLEILGTGSVTNNDSINVTYNVDNFGTLNNEAGATLDNSADTGVFANSGTVNNEGTLNAYSVTNAVSSNFNNSNVLTFNDFTNNGTFYQDGGATNAASTTATFDNSGEVFVDAGDVYVASFTNNAGAGVYMNGGTLTAETLENNNIISNDATINTVNFTNYGNVSGTGTTNITGDSLNAGTITQGLVTIDNNATFDNNGLLAANVSNASGSTLNSDPDDLGGNVANEGTLNLNAAGTLSIDVTGAGETNILGDLDNQGSITQDDINISSGVVVTTNASNMTATNDIENEGVINYTGGTTNNTITGAGRVDITGYVTNGGDITQTTVSNTGVFTNNGTVTANLNNSHDIEGTGSITTGTGISSNSGNITQATIENNGTFDNTGHITLSGALTNKDTFNTNADLLTAAGGIANEGNLNITGGTNANEITGTNGVVNFSNTVVNNGNITNDTVNNTGNLTNNALITANVTNSGTLNSNAANIDGDINNTGTYEITGGTNTNDITGSGTTSILGDTINNGSITQDTVTIASTGALATAADAVTANISNAGTLTWNADSTNSNVVTGSGALVVAADVTNNASVTQESVAVTGTLTTNADLIASNNGIYNTGDVVLTGGTNNNAINGTGDLEIIGDVTNNALVDQDTITVTSGKLTTAADALTTANGIVNNDSISFTGGDNNNIITGNGTTFIDGTVQNLADVYTEVQVNTGAHYGVGMNDIHADVENRGTVDLIESNIDANVTIGGTGTTNILGDTTNNGSIEQSALNIAAGGTLHSNSDYVEAAITNDGTYEITAGTGNTNVISGNGNLEINSGTTIANNAAISQGNITITNGTLSSNADLLASTNGITNNSGLELTGGTNNNVISGTGDLTTTGDVNNQAAISQDTITVSGGQLTSDASLLTATSGITNEAAISLTGGTNTNTISGNGTTYIDGTVENTGVIDTNIGVGTSGHYATTSDIDNALSNNGIVDITNADVNAAISGTGTTNILGITVNNGTIAQGNLNIASNGNFTTDIDDVTAAIANEGSMTWNNGSTNNNVVTGAGSLEITGGDIDNNAAISQGNITISGGALTSSADLLVSTNGITNNVADGLTLTGGTNANIISGTGSLVVDGEVVNNSTVNQDSITVSGGKLTTAADALTTANGITNNAEISFTGGDNNNEITGTGTTFIDGNVQNLADVYTQVQVNTGAHYGTATDIHADVENRGTLDLIDADIDNSINIEGTGTTNILGDTTNNGRISQSALNIAAGGALHSESNQVNAAINNDGTYEITAGTVNNNVISGNGDLVISGGDIINTAAINQGSIDITGGSLTSGADLLTTVAGINNDASLELTAGTNNNVITGTGDMTISGDVTNTADIAQNTLTNTGNFINDNGSIVADITNSGTFGNDGVITGDVTNTGTLISEGDDITGDITNNGSYVIVDGDNANDITGTGSITVQGNTTNTGVVAQDTITVANGATLVATDITDITTTSAIDNAGTLEMQGGTNANAITGTTGTLQITGAVTNTDGKNIVQDTINISTLGSLVADADDLNTVNGIANSGALTLKDGSNTNDISGNGTLTTNGAVDNSGNISQTSLNNTGTFTSDASLLAFADGITNTDTLNLTGGTNENTIEGANGTTNFTNDVVNNATINQKDVTNDTGTLTNNAEITAAFANNGGTVDNNAAITGAITNTGTINSTADNLVGAVTNNGTLNVAGGTVQNVITGTGDTNITDDLVNDYIIAQTNITNSANFTNSGLITADTFNNSGVVDNSNTITADITNSGTINSTADNLIGDIANDGELNLAGGTSTHGDITGTGTTNITDDLSVNNTIDQTTVTNTANLTVNDTITATDITNSGTITGKASDLVASNEIANEGTLVFNAASTGASVISGTGDVQVTADTTLSANNTYTGETLIDGATLTIAGQDNISVDSVVLFANDGVLQVTAAGSLDNLLKGQAATDNVTVQNDEDLTLNTAIGESTDFHKDGAGVMTLAMDSNGYTGDTYVDGGTLIGNTLNINNTVNGAAGTTVEFTDTADAELNAINTLGTFVKSGSALFNVEANTFSAAQADINSGIFAANRDITATVLNVNNGATLRGNGNITGTVNVNNGGTIAPGNSIDTLTITGDVNFANGSTTAIEINETPASDLLVITGNANIEGGANLTVSNENGRYFEWESFDIVNAGNVTGEYTYDGTITDYDASRINVEVDYSDPTKVVLVAKRKATDYETTTDGLSHNQFQASRAIDAVSTGFGGDITNALLQLEKLGGLNPDEVTLINPDSTLKTALADVAGTLYANNSLATLFNAKTAHVYDRIAKRNPSKGACPNCHDNVWAEYYSQYDKVYSDSNSSRYTNNMSGVLVGYDRSSENVLLGVYGGFGKSDLRQNDNSKMDLDDTTLGIYGGYTTGDWLFKGTLFGGVQHYNAKRAIRFMGRTANGSYDGVSLALDLEGSYSVPVFSWLTVRPFVGWLNNYSHQNAFSETGAEDLNLRVFGHDQFNSQVRLGVQLEGKVKNRLSWYGSAAVKQFIGDDYARLHMKLDNLPDTSMDIISAKLGGTYFSGQAGLTYAVTDNWSIFGNLDTGLSNKSANCYGNIGVAYTW